jgi:hypothetical protein
MTDISIGTFKVRRLTDGKVFGVAVDYDREARIEHFICDGDAEGLWRWADVHGRGGYKRPGEVVVHARGGIVFFDMAATVKRYREHGETGPDAVKYANADLSTLRRWFAEDLSAYTIETYAVRACPCCNQEVREDHESLCGVLDDYPLEYVAGVIEELVGGAFEVLTKEVTA